MFLVKGEMVLIFLFASFLLLLIVIISSNVIFALSDFNFGAAGDWGCNSNTGKTVSNIKNKSPERALALGDYSYVSTATCWLNKISSIKSIMKIAIGNHEDASGEGFSKYMSTFGLTKPYYSFNYQNVHVLVMATDSNFKSGSAQYNFVKNDLQNAKNNANIKWIVVVLHKVMYTSKNTCSSSSCSSSGSTAQSLRSTYHKIFDQNNVDIVFQGHVHNYQRSFPVKYSGGSTPTITSTSSTNYNDPAGEIFVTVGTGGVNFHALSGKASFVKYQQDDKFGALNLIISNNGYKLTGKYYTNDGSKKDEFSISKSGTSGSKYNFGPSLTLSG
jgi:Calcineurin-like phosphoesterase